MALNFFKIVAFAEILMLFPKIFGLLVLVKIKDLNVIGKSLNVPPPTLHVPRRLWE